jgi:hypothetical protein
MCTQPLHTLYRVRDAIPCDTIPYHTLPYNTIPYHTAHQYSAENDRRHTIDMWWESYTYISLKYKYIKRQTLSKNWTPSAGLQHSLHVMLYRGHGWIRWGSCHAGLQLAWKKEKEQKSAILESLLVFVCWFIFIWFLIFVFYIDALFLLVTWPLDPILKFSILLVLGLILGLNML